MYCRRDDLYDICGRGVRGSTRKVYHGPLTTDHNSCRDTRWLISVDTMSTTIWSLCQNPPVETLEALQQMLHCPNMGELKSTLVEIDSSVREKIKEESVAKDKFIKWAKRDDEYKRARASFIHQNIVHYEESGSSSAEGHHALQFLQAWANYRTRTTKLTPAQTANLNRTVVDYQSAMTFCDSL
jgi:hypothetical protein